MKFTLADSQVRKVDSNAGIVLAHTSLGVRRLVFEGGVNLDVNDNVFKSLPHNKS